MGYIVHHAVVITSQSSNEIEAAADYATSLGLQVLGPSAATTNNYRSLLICPDGSKEGWMDSVEGDTRRATMRQWLAGQRHEDGSSPLEWVEIAYGNDDGTAVVSASEWENTICESCGERCGNLKSTHIFYNDTADGIWICAECEEEAASVSANAESDYYAIQRGMGGRL